MNLVMKLSNSSEKYDSVRAIFIYGMLFASAIIAVCYITGALNK
jgi:hypothetical protein